MPRRYFPYILYYPSRSAVLSKKKKCEPAVSVFGVRVHMCSFPEIEHAISRPQGTQAGFTCCMPGDEVDDTKVPFMRNQISAVDLLYC